MSEIAIRKAMKKDDLRNSKIDNVTPLRAKKMYATLLSKYIFGYEDINKVTKTEKIGSKMKDDYLSGV